ncbi:MAG: hypothetical protein ACK5Z2_13600 [Bacteroidota bacterium]|jgi:hypothetical protein
MRPFLCIILASFFGASCSNEKTSTNVQTNQADSLKQIFAPILKGTWVLTNYMNAIAQTKSPLKSAEKLQGFVALHINDANQSDSMAVDASLNNHEGFAFVVYFQAGQNSACVKTNLIDNDDKSAFYELGYEIVDGSAFLFLYHYNKSNALLDKTQFSKVADKQIANNPSAGLQYMVNEKIFSGNYLLIDTKNSSQKISLKSDGTLSGHTTFTTYSVTTDFLGDPEPGFDEIVLNPQTINATSFAFKRANDSIYLYNTIGNEATGEPLKQGKIQYTLVRQ